MMRERWSRRQFLYCAGAAISLAAPRVARGQENSPPPNIVVIFTDDQVFRAMGYANPVVQTPHLDALAGRGVIFDRAYIATPICAASRASIMTGVYPQQHGAVGLDQSGFRQSVVESGRYRTIAHELAGNGYDTGFAGKSHLGPPSAYGFAVGEPNGDPYDGETFVDAARYIEGRAGNDTPFFLWVATHQPHVPLNPPPEFIGLYKDAAIEVDPNFRESPPPGSLYNQGLPGEAYYRDSAHRKNYKDMPAGPPRTKEQIVEFMRGYYATISHLDRQIGGMVDQLKVAGHYDNTVFVFLSDNGYHLGNHGLGNKITMHEESVRVPMFMCGPDIAAGRRSDALVSSLDVYPTLLDVAGIAKPDHLEGASLMPLLRGDAESIHDYVYSECVGVGGEKGMGHRMARGGRWKYILTDVNDEALFDLEADPYELDNVVADPANAQPLAELRQAMAAWMDRIGDTHAPPPTA